MRTLVNFPVMRRTSCAGTPCNTSWRKRPPAHSPKLTQRTTRYYRDLTWQSMRVASTAGETGLTPRQADVLAALLDLSASFGAPKRLRFTYEQLITRLLGAPVTELDDGTVVTDPGWGEGIASLQRHLRALENAGYIWRSPHQPASGGWPITEITILIPDWVRERLDAIEEQGRAKAIRTGSDGNRRRRDGEQIRTPLVEFEAPESLELAPDVASEGIAMVREILGNKHSRAGP